MVPGRVELLGKHTDYAGGRSLLVAVDRGITVVAAPGGDGLLAETDVSADRVQLTAGKLLDRPVGHWGHYLQAVVDRLTTNFGKLIGCRLRITSTLPPASGMSSSSALVVCVARALARLNELDSSPLWMETISSPIDLAEYLACMENGQTFRSLAGDGGVGTFGGSQDHTAMLCCTPWTASQFSFAPIRRERDVAMDHSVKLVVAVSGVSAQKTGAARTSYNRAAEATRTLLEMANGAGVPAHATLAEVVSDPEAFSRLRRQVDDPYLAARLEQFAVESEQLVPSATEALARSDLRMFGDVVDESMALAVSHLGNQVPETIDLASSARQLGARAASAFGAGFGGSVWALVDADESASFAEDWLARHIATHPHTADTASVMVTDPSGVASVSGAGDQMSMSS